MSNLPVTPFVPHTPAVQQRLPVGTLLSLLPLLLLGCSLLLFPLLPLRCRVPLPLPAVPAADTLIVVGWQRLACQEESCAVGKGKQQRCLVKEAAS